MLPKSNHCFGTFTGPEQEPTYKDRDWHACVQCRETNQDRKSRPRHMSHLYKSHIHCHKWLVRYCSIHLSGHCGVPRVSGANHACDLHNSDKGMTQIGTYHSLAD